MCYWLPTPSSGNVKERIELYLYSHSGHSWFVLGWTLPLHFYLNCCYTSPPHPQPFTNFQTVTGQEAQNKISHVFSYDVTITQCTAASNDLITAANISLWCTVRFVRCVCSFVCLYEVTHSSKFPAHSTGQIHLSNNQWSWTEQLVKRTGCCVGDKFSICRSGKNLPAPTASKLGPELHNLLSRGYLREQFRRNEDSCLFVHLGPTLRMRGAMPPLAHMSSHRGTQTQSAVFLLLTHHSDLS